MRITKILEGTLFSEFENEPNIQQLLYAVAKPYIEDYKLDINPSTKTVDSKSDQIRRVRRANNVLHAIMTDQTLISYIEQNYNGTFKHDELERLAVIAVPEHTEYIVALYFPDTHTYSPRMVGRTLHPSDGATFIGMTSV